MAISSYRGEGPAFSTTRRRPADLLGAFAYLSPEEVRSLVKVVDESAARRRLRVVAYFGEALGPDACRNDRCAPCWYHHTKQRARAGETLSFEDLVAIGMEDPFRRPHGRGWRQPGALFAAEVEDDPSRDVEGLKALIAIGAEW